MENDHFIRHRWARERADWNFNILFEDQPQVARYADQYAAALEHPGLYDPVPAAWLHATILRVGFFDDFSEDEMLTVLHRLEPTLAAMKVPKLLLGQWWIWGGNPCVHFTPDEPLNAIFKAVLSEVSAVVGTDRLAQSLNFMPHITLAYSKTYSDKHGLFIQLQNQRIDAVPVRINRLSLVKQYVIDNYYAWDVIREIPVGQL